MSTGSSKYANIALVQGADVPFLRSAKHTTDTAPSMGFILHALETLVDLGDVYDYLVLQEPTSPLTEARNIDDGLQTLV